MLFNRLLWCAVLIGSMALMMPLILLVLVWDTRVFLVAPATLLLPWMVVQTIALKNQGRRGWLLVIGLFMIAVWPVVYFSCQWSCRHGAIEGCVMAQ
jgi:hypothetical protein